jgi:hypothetical protein
MHAPDWQVVPPAQTLPQVPQWLSSDDRSEHEPEHKSGVVEGQPERHPNAFPTGPQMGALPVHVVVHEPHVDVEERSVSHPSPGLAEQWAYPGSQLNEHCPPMPQETLVPSMCGSLVQSLLQLPHVCRSVADTQPAAQKS